jgi:type II secretory pathway pseudopilin PulG
MAILAGAIAPALIRYIDKSRKSNDVSSCKTIKTAVETALGNESIYEVLTNCNNKGCVIIEVVPGKPTAEEAASTNTTLTTSEKKGLKISQCAGIPQGTNITEDEVFEEIATNIGEKTPKVKYKKDVEITATTTAATGSTANTFTPSSFYAVISKKGTVYVFIGSTGFTAEVGADGALKVTNGVQICPEIDKEYQ